MARELIQTKPLSAFSVNAARASLAFGISYASLLFILHFIKPELDPTWRFISEYGLGKYGWTMTLTFISIAGSQISILLTVRTQVKTVIGYFGLFLLAVSAFGILIAASFQTDPITTSPDTLTPSGYMHVVGASLDWTPLAALFISLSLARTKAWAAKKKQMMFTSLLMIAITIAFTAVAASAAGKFGPGVFAGLLGRLLIWSYLGWIAPIALHAIRTSKQEVDLG